MRFPSCLTAACALVFPALALASAEAQTPGRRPATGVSRPATTPPCVIEANQISARQRTPVSAMSLGSRAPSRPPKPQRTAAARASNTVPAPAQLNGDLSPQLCESLRTGTVSGGEETAMMRAMEANHARQTHQDRRRFRKGPVSYTYEYTLEMGGLRFDRQPGVGYCTDFDWRYKVRNVSQRDFTVFSTTGEVGLCFSPAFGLFYVPGLSSIMPFPIPGLCLDDAQFTKLDMRNVNNDFEDGLVALVDLAFEKLQKKDAKVCIIGAPSPPWFMPVIVRPADMVAYCTSTRDCKIDQARLTSAFQAFVGSTSKDD